MTIQVVTGWDATHDNLPFAPKSGQPAGYTTGSGGIAWDSSDWGAHPHAIRIDQDASAGDGTADVLDVENGAATPAECPGWVQRARTNLKNKVRAGQRDPVIYVNGSNIHLVATALANAGITGVGIWLANPGVSLADAISVVEHGSGPYPIIGVQYAWLAKYDLDVWNKTWVYGPSSPPPSSGPYRHEIPRDNTYGFTGWAQELRHESPAALLSYNKGLVGQHLSQEHYNLLAALYACDLASDAAKIGRVTMKPGTVIYTKNP